MEKPAKKPRGIRFYKKIWYSIAKFDKYEDMVKEGVKSSLNYLCIIAFICAVIFTILQMFYITKTYKIYVENISEDIPELSYSNGELNFQTEEILELDNKRINELIGGKLIIDMTNDYDETLEQYNSYLDSNQSTVILLKNKFITVDYNNDNEVKSYDYDQSLDSFLENIGQTTEFNKQDVINYFSEINYGVYIMEYLIIYFVSYLLVFLVFIIMAMLIGILCAKVAKIKLNWKQLFSIATYSYTLSIIIIIVYSLLNVITGITVKYIQFAYMIIAYIYLITVIINQKDKMRE